MNLLQFVVDKHELEQSIDNVIPPVRYTLLECHTFCYANDPYDDLYKLKIDSVLDYLHDELNSGHWSKISLKTRRAFTVASFLKANILLRNTDGELKKTLDSTLQTVDTGLLLGAPLEDNPNILTDSARFLSEQIKRLTPRVVVEKKSGTKRKISGSFEYKNIDGKEISALERPSLETFNENCFKTQTPVKLQDCLLHWPATKKWLDINYLLEVAGSRTIPVEIGSHYADENWTQKLMSLRDFIYNHYLGDSSNIGYLAQHNLFDQIPELRNDILIPEYCALSRDYENSTEPDINAWFGPNGTVSPLHFDPKDNLLAQVYGTKQIVLYSPVDSDYLYPHEDRLLFNTARVDPLKPDFEKYPRLRQATTYKCLLEPGEMLYIPPKWWHHVVALDKSFSVSFWWQ